MSATDASLEVGSRACTRDLPAAGRAPVYATHASPSFNEYLHDEVRRIADEAARALGDDLVALVLGGGYGRGEGGVILVDGVERPYNDLDFALLVRRRSVSVAPLEDVSRRAAERLGIHVDFSRPLTIADIRAWPHCLMWYDFLHGHVVVAGPADILEANAPPYMSRPLPAVEGTRLLLNRGAGLLQAWRTAAGVDRPHDADFARRNYYKCALALGDAVLIAHGRYSTPYAGRDSWLATLSGDEPQVDALDLVRPYSAALRFKFRPDAVLPSQPTEAQVRDLASRWGRAFLHVEGRRRGAPWRDVDSYVGWAGIREPEQHRGPRLLRNLLQNVRMGKWSWRYAREGLYRELPRLLGLTAAPAADWREAGSRFLDVWRRFN